MLKQFLTWWISGLVLKSVMMMLAAGAIQQQQQQSQQNYFSFELGNRTQTFVSLFISFETVFFCKPNFFGT